LERLARDKHASLLQKSVKYFCKKFYRIPAGLPTTLDFSATARKILEQAPNLEACNNNVYTNSCNI
jgi:hypothetical protein